MPIYVYKWSDGLGHVGCQLNEEVYIGHWPKNKKVGSNPFRKEKGNPKSSLEADKAAMKKTYDKSITIYKLDDFKNYAIKQWKNEVSSAPYNPVNNSCATMVAKALLMSVHDYISDKHGTNGGDRAMAEILNLKGNNWNKSISPSNMWGVSSISIHVWTPDDVYQLARVIRDDVSR